MSASSDYLATLTRLTEAKGAVQAEAARQNGALWGNAIGNIGLMVSQYPEQQAKLKEIANRADLTNLEKQREQRIAATEQRNLQSQQQAQQIIANTPRNADGTYDTASLMQKITANGGDPKTAEQIATSLDNINQFTLKYNQQQRDQVAEWADNAQKDVKPDDPEAWSALHFHVEAAPLGFISDADKKQLADLEQQGVSPVKMLQEMKSRGTQFKPKPPKYGVAAPGSTIYEENTGATIGTVPTKPEKPKTPEEVLYDSLDPNSPTQAISASVIEKHAQDAKDAITNKPLTPYEREELARRDQELKLSQGRLDVAIKNSNKAGAAKASSDIVQAVIDHPELWGQLTPTTKANIAGALESRGFTAFQKPPSATVENRLASARAVSQTGEDIIAQLKDPKIAGQLGPALGRYNSLREFLGNPPPELSELAGTIESYALANMGVHGMRSVQGADEIKSLLDRKHTPESLIKTIEGLNKFSSHFMENEGVKGGSSSPASTGLPAIGSTFQGGKVLKVTPVP